MKIHIRKGDNVVVLGGKDKGKIGRILVADPDNGRVIVEGVNVITRHKKARSAQEQGGLVKDNGTIDSSNVMVICPVCNKPTRIAKKVVDGKKHRVCKHCDASLDEKAKVDKKQKKVKAAAANTEDAESKKKQKKATPDTAAKPTKKKADTAAASDTAAKPTKKKAEAAPAADTAAAPKKVTKKKVDADTPAE